MLATENIRTISKTGKLIFQYPEKTLLDNIPSDLWGDILPYYEVRDTLFNNQKICIGNYSKKYPGYRLITNDECNRMKFLNSFEESYLSNGGLFSLDTCRGKFIFVDGGILRINEDIVSPYRRTKMIYKGDIVRLEAASSVVYFENNIEWVNSLDFFGGENGIGLFVKTNIF